MTPSLSFFLLFICLFIVLETTRNVFAAVVYGLVSDAEGNSVIVSVNNSTGGLTTIAKDTYKFGYLFLKTSCFDQTNKVFYYVCDNALYPVDVATGKELHPLKYDPGLVFSCFINNSQVLVTLSNAQTEHYTQLVAFPLAPSNDPPKIVADLPAYNITQSFMQAYDPNHNVYFSLFYNNIVVNQNFLQTADLDHASYANQSFFPCLPSVIYLKYDIVKNKLVGLTVNFTTSGGIWVLPSC
eukprot:Phypoly_transcript_12869.p1 GENE.Phypoly_transcript_12869~~Phypoly_transcript_12869.p1  ORF type:complete len:240 (+),score=21.85 Phypoly_transcript_12869:35-754(+)